MNEITDNRLKRLWIGQGGWKEVLALAIPLILSTGVMTLQMFIDRMFLLWYGSEYMGAAAYGGLVSFTIFCFFLGIVTYVNTFVAQYDGAGRPERIGPAIWQGIYFAIGAGLIVASTSFFSDSIIGLAGHDPQVQKHEVTYFSILVIGAMPGLIPAAFSCFYTGRGKTWTVMWISIAATLLNVVLDYGLIFGNLGLPEMGIAGAAWATVASSVQSTIIYILLFAQKKYRKRFATLSGYRFDWELFRRLMRFGVPSGTQFMLDIMGFTFFVAFVGRISTICLAASSMTWQINSLAFMPMIGINTAVCTLVGRYLGQNRPGLAQRCTWSALAISMIYMISIASCFLIAPGVFMYPFKSGADPAEFAQIQPIVMNLLFFVAFYCIFDSGNLIFSGALKGAGDTRYVMFMSVSMHYLLMVLPAYLAIRFFEGTTALYLAWTALTGFVCFLAIAFMLRFLGGKWKSMRVIEAAPQLAPQSFPAIPTIEAELTEQPVDEIDVNEHEHQQSETRKKQR